MSGDVKVLDAGGTLMLSGASSDAVQAALDKLLARGAQVVTPVSLVGRNWVASCTLPERAKRPDETQTLNLSELARAQAPQASAEPNDGCRIEEIGLQRVIYGPSVGAVNQRIEYLKQRGGKVVVGVEEIDGEFVAVCDMGGAQG